MSGRPFSVCEDCEQQIGQETYHVLTKSIEARTAELGKQTEEANSEARTIPLGRNELADTVRRPWRL